MGLREDDGTDEKQDEGDVEWDFAAYDIGNTGDDWHNGDNGQSETETGPESFESSAAKITGYQLLCVLVDRFRAKGYRRVYRYRD